MSASHRLPRQTNRFSRSTRDSTGFTTSRETAMRLLGSCVEAKLTCFDEILRYIDENTPRTRRLLEDMLRLEERHAEELIDVLQLHRAATGVRLADRSVPSPAG
jgi:hypothetical protein